MWETDEAPDSQPVLDYAHLPAQGASGPSRGSVLAAWLMPVGMQAYLWLLVFRADRPSGPLTLEGRVCNFLRAIIGPMELVLDQMKIHHGNGVWLHGAMAVMMWTAVLLGVTMTPIRRLPWVVHFLLSLVMCFGGCCLVVGDNGY